MNLKSFLLAGLDWSTFSQFTMLPSWSILSLFWRSRTHVTLSLLGSLDSQSISCLCLCNFKEGGTYYYIFRHEVILTQKKWRYKRILDAKLLKLRESGVQDSIRRSWEDDLPRCKVLNDDDDSIALGPGLNIWSTFNANIIFAHMEFIEKLIFTFTLLGVGYIVSVSIFGFEMGKRLKYLVNTWTGWVHKLCNQYSILCVGSKQKMME